MSHSSGIRVAVVGVGYWGSKHIRVLRSLSEVDKVVGVDQRYAGSQAGSAVVELGIEVYGDLDKVLPDVDAVVIATPPSTHWEIGMAAIAAGRHVLIEKPLATTTAEAQLLVSAADAANVILMVGHTYEHNVFVHKLREVVLDRAFGQLYYLDCARLNLGLFQKDVNVIYDLAPHDISIANFILGALPESVNAWGARYVNPDYEDVAHLRLNYPERGVTVNIHLSWLYPTKIRTITAVGAKKMAVFDDVAAEEKIRVYAKAADPIVDSDIGLCGVAYSFGDVISPYVPATEPLATQERHFVNCITQDARPSTDGHSGMSVVRVLECAQISLAEHRTVALDEVGGGRLMGTGAAPSVSRGLMRDQKTI